MNRLQKLKNDIYTFEELDTLEKNARKLSDTQTLAMIDISRASKTAKGEKPKKIDEKNETARMRRDRLRKGG